MELLNFVYIQTYNFYKNEMSIKVFWGKSPNKLGSSNQQNFWTVKLSLLGLVKRMIRPSPLLVSFSNSDHPFKYDLLSLWASDFFSIETINCQQYKYIKL